MTENEMAKFIAKGVAKEIKAKLDKIAEEHEKYPVLSYVKETPIKDYLKWINKHRMRRSNGSRKWVFTDGSGQWKSTGGKRLPAGIGVFFGFEDPKNIAEPLDEEKATNQRAEVMAVKRALDVVLESGEEPKILTIVSDSEWTIKSLTCEYRSTANTDLLGKTTENLEKLMKLGWKIEFNHVRGHQKKPLDTKSYEYFLWYGNDWADTLAGIGNEICKKRINGGFDESE